MPHVLSAPAWGYWWVDAADLANTWPCVMKRIILARSPPTGWAFCTPLISGARPAVRAVPALTKEKEIRIPNRCRASHLPGTGRCLETQLLEPSLSFGDSCC